MLRNGKDIADGAVITTQVCIVGSGPAGITAAWELQKAGVKVTLIEGGPNSPGGALDPTWDDKTLLYAGKADGQFAESEPDFLIRPNKDTQDYGPWERERMFGGTSAHWGGQSRPLDPIDFEARPGFPGWPIDRAELDPYYAEAARLCVLHGDDFSPETWAGILGAEVPELTGFDTTIYQYLGKPYRNFALRAFDGVTIADSDVDVIVNATLLGIDQQQGRVRSLKVASMDGGSPPKKATGFTIEADIVVLACGAVENARQLLLSNVGNDHDQVGRYFMCHPLSNGPVLSAGGAYLTDAQNRLMAGKTLSGNRPVPWQDANGVHVSGRFSPKADEQKRLGVGSCWFWADYGQYYFEMAPNPDSRITLADTVDPVFGQRQTHITWLLSDRDEATYTQTTGLFKAAVEELGGDFYCQPWSTVKAGLTVNGHHIGTTRMSADPQDGVVDADLKVHGLDNLYVAGSSVFPSTGISNPTFTIIALSIRLAEHLRGRVGAP
ncbi:FAD-dependent oxidoreductase [Caulobacter endophyticus]|uniref:FAD-dependent oxidoreductase n=1 Tax=Caulobacter endophyticus TaxID=2172652 RepID=UPI00240F7388|nr:GMC family oxidoreductase [Caulobacter endophyticus]MDG2530294.1 GMC family oxidoreductase [Caulobacter endophyticus]